MSQCEYYETCSLRLIRNDLIGKYRTYYCFGDEYAVKGCQYRDALIKIEKLEKQLDNSTEDVISSAILTTESTPLDNFG